MRIAFFTDSYVPELNGVAASVVTLYEELRKLGHEVYVFAPSHPQAHEDPFVYRIGSISLPMLKERRAAFPGPGIRENLRHMCFDIVHTHSEFMMGRLGRNVARRLGCPQVHTYHTIWEDYTYYITRGVAEDQARRFARSFSRSWCNGCDLVIVPTAKTEALLRGYGVEPPIRILPTGMDIARFAPVLHDASDREARRRECGVPDGAKVLLNIGRISREKNLEAVIEGMPEVFARHPQSCLVLIGSGPWVENLRTLAASLGIGHRVFFPGPKPWEEIDRYYAIGDLFVSASQSETQGLTYIEALASGLPVVARDDPALRDVVRNGENGYLFETPEEMQWDIDQALSFAGETLRRRAAPSVAHYDRGIFGREMEKTYQAARYLKTGNPEDKPDEMPPLSRRTP